MNSVNIIGRLEKEPKLLQTKRGRDILRFILKRERQVAYDDEFYEKIDRIPCFAVDDKAVSIATHMHKGHRIAITGHLQSFVRLDSSNTEFIQVEVYVDKYESLTPRVPKYVEQSA